MIQIKSYDPYKTAEVQNSEAGDSNLLSTPPPLSGEDEVAVKRGTAQIKEAKRAERRERQV